MSANLTEKRRLSKTTRSHISQPVVPQSERREPVRRYSIRYSMPLVTDDDEMKFVAKAVLWMVVLAVTPLILFYIITFFDPDFFLIPIAP